MKSSFLKSAHLTESRDDADNRNFRYFMTLPTLWDFVVESCLSGPLSTTRYFHWLRGAAELKMPTVAPPFFLATLFCFE
jgi:hypothetical protein